MTPAIALERERATSVSSRSLTAALCLLALTVVAGITAYFSAFSNMAPYDDEGYFITSLRHFLDGEVLYDQTDSVYGPLYYFYQWAAHHILGAPVSHDSVRFVSIAFWLATTAVCFLVVHQLTRSLIMAAIAQVMTFRALAFLGEEPAHPQEACVLLLLVLAFLACSIADQTIVAISFGALGGAIALTKINLGVFVCLGLGIVLLSGLEKGRWQRVGLWLTIIASALLPVILMRGHLSERWAAAFCVVEVLSILAVTTVVTRTAPPARFKWRDVLAAIVGFAAAIILISSFVAARGTTPASMLKWLVIWPATKFTQSWSIPMPIKLWAIAWAAICLLAAWFCVKTKNYKVIAFLKAGFAVSVMALCWGTGHYGLIGFVIPLLWLVAIPPAGSSSTEVIGRKVLAVVGVLQVLYAYPVATSQMRMTTVYVILAALLCLWDVLLPIRERLPIHWPRLAGAAAAVVFAGICLDSAWVSYHGYQSLSALQLPGSSRIHLKPDRVLGLQKIVAEARTSCASLLTAPGMYSLNSWSGIQPPRHLRAENWMSFQTDQEQAEVIRELSADPRSCVIYNPWVLRIWTRGASVSSKPLMSFIQQNFHVAKTEYGYQLMLPN